MNIIKEGAASIKAEETDVVTKKLEVFYNPVMKLNRDLTLLFLLAQGRTNLRIADPLAGSGVRSIRMLKELPENMIESISINDGKEGFVKQCKENCKRSKCQLKKLHIEERDANRFLLSQPSFDYIDIDPFGSPNQFLDSAIKKTKRKGVLAITATDTAPLCGTYPKACKRKYWATPRRDYLMHEYGLRILIRKCQLIGAQYDKALTPIFSYSKHHYFRIFFDVQVGKTKVDAVLAQHKTIDGFGPLWTGQLWEKKMVASMTEHTKDPATKKLLDSILEETTISKVGFYDVHELARELKLVQPPRSEDIIEALHKKKMKATRTHFTPLGIKTTCDEKTIKQVMKRLVS